MKKEFGKWMMDIAKYIVTAVLLATVFSEISDRLTVYLGFTENSEGLCSTQREWVFLP